MQPIKFGGLKKTALSSKAAPKKPGSTSVFGAGADDDDEPVPLPPHLLGDSSKAKVSTATLNKAQKAKQAAELQMDQSVYEYDEVYDNMKEGSRLAALEKKKESGERKVILMFDVYTVRSLLCADS